MAVFRVERTRDYPRTDSRYLTDDMEGSVPGLVSAAAAVCGMEKPPTICAKQVCSSQKVTDHHAIVPTISAEKVDMASLPLGEREVLKLAAKGLLRAVDEPHRYAETVITVDSAGQSFTAKGKTVLTPGWKRYEQEQVEAAPALPVVTENQTLSVSAASVKTGKTTPPKHFTEDMVLRFFPTFSEEIHNIYDAMKLRGIALSWKNVFTRPMLILEAIAIPIVMRSASIAEELSASAVTRGIDNPAQRTSFIQLKVHAKDWMVFHIPPADQQRSGVTAALAAQNEVGVRSADDAG